MKKSRINWTLKRVIKEIESGAVSFDYPIQRAGDQWDNLQKSLLVHSVANDYPIPAIFFLTNEEEKDDKKTTVYYVLDGKQRLTNLASFVGDDYKLHDDTPLFILDGVEHDLKGKLFSELPENIADEILGFNFDIFELKDASDSIVEDIFFRLNNGLSLSKQQKAKAKMGVSGALMFKNLMEHSLMKTNAKFTELQKRKADDEVALVQAMMLIDPGYEVGRFGTNEVFEYTTSLREGKEEVFNTIEKVMDYLHSTLKDSHEKVLLRKVHLPFVLYAAYDAMNNGISNQLFDFWIEHFKGKITSKENGVMLNGAENPNAWLYKIGGGAGSTKAEKVSQRLQAVQNELEALYSDLEKENREEQKQLEEIRNAKNKNENTEIEIPITENVENENVKNEIVDNKNAEIKKPVAQKRTARKSVRTENSKEKTKSEEQESLNI